MKSVTIFCTLLFIVAAEKKISLDDIEKDNLKSEKSKGQGRPAPKLPSPSPTQYGFVPMKTLNNYVQREPSPLFNYHHRPQASTQHFGRQYQQAKQTKTNQQFSHQPQQYLTQQYESNPQFQEYLTQQQYLGSQQLTNQHRQHSTSKQNIKGHQPSITHHLTQQQPQYSPQITHQLTQQPQITHQLTQQPQITHQLSQQQQITHQQPQITHQLAQQPQITHQQGQQAGQNLNLQYLAQYDFNQQYAHQTQPEYYQTQQQVQYVPQQRAAGQQQFYYQPVRQGYQQYENAQYITDNSVDAQQYYTPQYVYLQQHPAASDAVASVVDPKRPVQLVMYITPVTRPEDSQVVYQTDGTQQNYAAAQEAYQQTYYQQDASQYLLQQDSTAPKSASIYHHMSKQQPTSLLDSYVPSSLQIQYYKQQEQVQGNAIAQQQAKSQEVTGKTDYVKSPYARPSRLIQNQAESAIEYRYVPISQYEVSQEQQ